MPFFKFKETDIIRNTVKVHPKSRFFIYNAQVFYNEQDDGTIKIGLSDNLSGAYPFVYKGGELNAWKTVSTDEFSNAQYGDVLTGSYPYTAQISRDYYASSTSPRKVDALGNPLKSYSHLSARFTDDYSEQELALISIPPIFIGSSIQKGSVKLQFYVSGALQGQIEDTGKDGLLRETTGSNTGATAGLVLYNHGVILLTGSWELNSSHTEEYIPGDSPDNPKWIHFGTTGSNDAVADGSNVHSSSFNLEFNSVNHINTLTMFAHTYPGELNHSNNPTYCAYGQTGSLVISGSTSYVEYPRTQIKNIVTSSFTDSTGSFSKQTYISKVAIYDKKGNVLGIAKLARAVRKREIDGYTFKLRMDI